MYYRIWESDFSHDQNILFALEENAIHRRSKLDDPSKAPNPCRFGPPTDNPYRHCRKEEAAPHLHTGYNKSKLEQLRSA
jgi:hypothetical protein